MNRFVPFVTALLLASHAFAGEIETPQYREAAAQAAAVQDARPNQDKRWSHFTVYSNDPRTGYQTVQDFDNNVVIVEDNKFGTQYLVFRLPNGQFTTVQRQGPSTACYTYIGFLCIPQLGQINTQLEERRTIENQGWAGLVQQFYDRFKGFFGG